MIAFDLITDTIPPLKMEDTGAKALTWMDELKVKHLPITNEKIYVGIISESEILDLNSPEKSFNELQLSLTKPFTNKTQHIYEIISIASNLDLSVLPVVEDETYLGNIPTSHLFHHFSQMASMQERGGLIVLELNVNDYHLSEIARIVESNNAKILSSYITSHSDSTKLEVTLKINKTELSDILQTFTRYDYVVTASYHSNKFEDDFKDRLAFLMNYINI